MLHDDEVARTDAETGEMAVSPDDDIPASQSKVDESKEAGKGKSCIFA